MNAVLRKSLADLGRKRLQSVVVGLVVILATGTATLALILLFNSTNPYDQAFARQRGGHVLQEFNGQKVTAVQLRQTANLPAVASAAGPWRADGVSFEQARVPASMERMVANFGLSKMYLEVVGRSRPGGPVDDLRLTFGHWPCAASEIVVTRSFALSQGVSVGDPLIALIGSRRPRLTIVGEAIDVDAKDAANQSPQHAWVLPGALAKYISPGDHPVYEMAYRFHRATTAADLRAALASIRSVLPAGSLDFTFSYLDIRNTFNVTNSLILTFLLAFSVFALGAAALIIANIVSGAVIAGYREIGVMKAVGYTPVQVVQVLVWQMLIPALAGSAAGIPLGVLLSRPLLSQSADAMGLPAPSAFSASAVLLVLAGLLLVVCLSAAIPACRAGLLSPVRAMVAGTAPQGHRGARLAGRLAALRVPQAVRLGVGQSFARPLRASFTVAAVLIGVATVTFAFGIRATLERGLNDPALTGGNYQVEVSRIGTYPDARVMRTLRAQPETAAIVARDWGSVSVDGLSQPVQSVFTRGKAASLGLRPLQGRWYAGRGEAVAPSAFLKEAHLRVGDYFYGSINGRRMRFHLVGTVFDTSEFGRILHMDLSTLAVAVPGESPSDYLVRLRPGADAQGFAIRVNRTALDSLSWSMNINTASSVIATINVVVVVLALVLALIAVAAVFNTVLLNTRERVRDMAILKAVGMTPRGAIAMVATSAAILGLIGGVAGIPLGVALHRIILQAMLNEVGNDTNPVRYDVFNGPILVALVLGGMGVAVAGAYLPARWSAGTEVADALRSE